ncbi:MAG: M48 family metallopeptidase [Tannerella sp.]|jgi:predicted metal-dependent hydrolase|nr:M48 family metallopeptidase [Tannerella sp.]
MEKTVYIEGLGDVVLRRSPRAQRNILRVKDRRVFATMPLYGTEKDMIAFIRRMHGKLLRLLDAAPERRSLNEDSTLQTLTFRLHIFRTPRANFYTTLKDDVLHIACPDGTDFEDERVQQLLRQMLKKALRHEACRILPARIEALAERHGFHYADVKIRDTKTRWGSCSSRKNISLSLSLLLLPEHLIDYVLLHELCHTVEMNHGKRFLQLLERVTDNRSQILRRELKAFRPYVE